MNWLGDNDYAYIDRGGDTVAYYNAQYARALGMAASLAQWFGDAGRSSAWLARAAAVKAQFAGAFWDPSAGAFSDTANDDDVHALDGNVFAILAGLATPAQQQSILSYIGRAMTSGIGDTIVDSSAWDGPRWGAGGRGRIYPFISYFDVLARYAAGADDSALDLIRKTWGYMLVSGPGTMWETIDTGTGRPVGNGSLDHGWSSGAAPALTSQVLGVQPTSPGFATFTVTPNPSDLDVGEGRRADAARPDPRLVAARRGQARRLGDRTARGGLDERAAARRRALGVSAAGAGRDARADGQAREGSARRAHRNAAAQLVSQLRRERYVL